MNDDDMDVGELSPAQQELYLGNLGLVYQVADRMIRGRRWLESVRDEMLNAGMGKRGLVRAARDYKPERCNKFAPYATMVIKQAIKEMLRDRDEEKYTEVKVGLDDEVIRQKNPPEVSLDDLVEGDEDGLRWHDKVTHDRRKPEPLSPLDELIRAEEMGLIEEITGSEIYEALREYTNAKHGDKGYVLKIWADRLNYKSTEAFRKVLEREGAYVAEQLGEDFLVD